MSPPAEAPSAPATRPPGQPTSLKDKLVEIFGMDLRSLALLRVGLGVVLLGELITRMQDLRAHYTDAGVLPRSILPSSLPLCFHAFSGEAWFQVLLFLTAGVFAVLLLVGMWTRVATVVSWLLLVSLQARNIVLMHNGDVVLRMMLLWGIFLPLGACWSVDARSSRRPASAPPMVLSAATFAYVMQMVMIYWFAVAWKYAPEWRQDFTAVHYALHVDTLATPLARVIRQYPDLMKVLTWLTLVVEGVGPALLLFPFATQPLRIVTVAAFILLHTGFGLCLVLGNFAPVCYVAWAALLPPLFWEWVAGLVRRPERTQLTIYYDQDSPRARGRAGLAWSFLLFSQSRLASFQEDTEGQKRRRDGEAWLVVSAEGQEHRGFEAVSYLTGLSPVFWVAAPVLRLAPVRRLGERLYGSLAGRPERPPSQPPPSHAQLTSEGRSGAEAVVVLVMLAYVFLWNLRTLEERLPPRVRAFLTGAFPHQMDPLGFALGLNQGWGVFAPAPGKIHGWFVVKGNLEDGTAVDIFHDGAPVTWDKPADVASTYVNSRWRRYLQNYPDNQYISIRPYFSDYLWREWEREHPDRKLESVQVYFMAQKTLPDGLSPPEKVLLYTQGALSGDGARAAEPREMQ